mmetsp:Transcript_38802/g.58276  ORF Transcript_38802/g.58276 Transcript_38802/m.58276 type:complete len:82 (+) Transcript_38802:218-463(+)
MRVNKTTNGVGPIPPLPTQLPKYDLYALFHASVPWLACRTKVVGENTDQQIKTTKFDVKRTANGKITSLSVTMILEKFCGF